MSDVTFAHSEFLWLLALIPLLALWYGLRNYQRTAKVKLSSLEGFEGQSNSTKGLLRHGLILLRLVALAGLITAMARPQSSTSWQDISTEGIDIVLALDISGSMLARDLQPNRLEASKEVALEFIDNRPNDRIGLVIYSGESFTQCPLTTDHARLKNLFTGIKNGVIVDGTAIGMGLATAVNRLKESDAESKVAILLTDGSNNRGSIPPITAAEIAKTFDVRVYTIGVGTNGMAPMPARDAFGNTVYRNVEVKIDEETLKEIAQMTGGKYFRATDNQKLRDIYGEIDQLEKTIIEEIKYEKKNEEFWPWVLFAGILLAVEFIIRHIFFRSVVLS